MSKGFDNNVAGTGATRRGGIIGGLNRLMTQHVRRRLGEEQGIAALEFGILLPILIILMLGAVEMFQASTASRRLTRVTNTMGDLITQAKGTLTQADIKGYYNAAQYIMGQFEIKDRLAISVYTFRMDKATNKPKLSWKHHEGDYTCKSSEPTLTKDQKDSMKDGNDLVLTFGCYKYPIAIGKLVLGNITLDMGDEVTLRPRQQLQVQCTDCAS